MLETLSYWYKRYLSHPEAGQLLIALILFFTVITTLSKMLAPVFISIVLAYLIEWLVVGLQYCKLNRKLAVIIAFIIFIILVYGLIGLLFPLLIKQISSLIDNLPSLTSKVQQNFQAWLNHTNLISDKQISDAAAGLKGQLSKGVNTILSSTLTVITNTLEAIVYFVMVPLLIYFFLMDKSEILQWCKRFLPNNRAALTNVWNETYTQLNNYVRGKVLVAIINAVLTAIAFFILGMDYTILLSVAVGLSTFIPYIGAVVVTIPIILLGILQWGMSAHFIIMLIVYFAITTFEGTVLTALLFSKAVSLHPIIVIASILVFGDLFGIWGVLFAIPLTSMLKAFMEHWPTCKVEAKTSFFQRISGKIKK